MNSLCRPIISHVAPEAANLSWVGAHDRIEESTIAAGDADDRSVAVSASGEFHQKDAFVLRASLWEEQPAAA